MDSSVNCCSEPSPDMWEIGGGTIPPTVGISDEAGNILLDEAGNTIISD